MFAIGCLFPVLLFIGGAIIGALLGGSTGTMWGAISGAGLGLVMLAALFGVLRKAGKQ